MTVYVDELKNYGSKGNWCHMIADSLDELHQMADKIELKRSWFQNTNNPHYDLRSSKRTLAIKFGAKPVTREEIYAILKVRKLNLENN